MKTFVKIFAIAVTFVALITSCETVNPQTGISGKLISNSNCKSNELSVIDSETSDTLSCIEYEYELSEKTLHLKHINAGFNCCPGEITCSAKLNNDTIVVQEFEKSPLCNCDCLFDLDIEISGVEEGKYFIQIKEPYCGEQNKLHLLLDFTMDKEGTVCVTRKQYPWGMSQIK
ncbi:MAG: hypothetical protein WCR42_10080 [bacterium]